MKLVLLLSPFLQLSQLKPRKEKQSNLVNVPQPRVDKDRMWTQVSSSGTPMLNPYCLWVAFSISGLSFSREPLGSQRLEPLTFLAKQIWLLLSHPDQLKPSRCFHLPCLLSFGDFHQSWPCHYWHMHFGCPAWLEMSLSSCHWTIELTLSSKFSFLGGNGECYIKSSGQVTKSRNVMPSP